jgi:hypothetical protein
LEINPCRESAQATAVLQRSGTLKIYTRKLTLPRPV